MKNAARWTLFGLAVFAQLAAPGYMIANSEDILATGAAYRFKTKPVDPEDAFRGKYVALGFDRSDCPADSAQRFKAHQKAFALISRDSDGFAQVTGLVRGRPKNGDYIKVTVKCQSNQVVSFQYPFDKYFLEEESAPKAERLYREHNLRGKQDAFVVVRLKNGAAVIEDLVIGGLPIRDALRRDGAKGDRSPR